MNYKVTTAQVASRYKSKLKQGRRCETDQCISKLDDVRYRLDGFETTEQVNKESVIRVQALLNSDVSDDVVLGEILEHCPVETCGSAACSRCSRDFRIKKFAQISAISRKYVKTYAVTIIYYDRYLTDQELHELEPKVYMDRLRKQLIRIGFKYPVIGSLEFDYHAEQGLWQPHFHLLAMAPKEAIEPLRKYYKGKRRNSSAKIDRAMQVKAVKDSEDVSGKFVRNKAKAISYTLKSFSQEVRSWTDENGRRRTKKFRLDDNRFRLSLRVYDRIGFNGLLFLYNVRRQGEKLVVSEK